MPSSKGEPDNPKLREKVKEEVKAMSKGGGPGSWSAWKAGELARRYEAEGGGYIDKGEHKNKSQKGPPEKKDVKEDKKKDKEKEEEKPKTEEKGEEKEKAKDKEDEGAKKGEKQEEKKDEGKTEKGAKGGKGKAGAGKKK